MTWMNDTPDAGLWYALSRLETNYWREVDLNGGRDAHEFYLPDGVLAFGADRFAGQDQIRAFHEWRAGRGPITARHLISDLRVFEADDGQVRLVAALSQFRASGRPPTRVTDPLVLLADVIGECVREENGTWRYRSHVVKPVFIGTDMPLWLSIDTRFLDKRGKPAT